MYHECLYHTRFITISSGKRIQRCGPLTLLLNSPLSCAPFTNPSATIHALFSPSGTTNGAAISLRTFSFASISAFRILNFRLDCFSAFMSPVVNWSFYFVSDGERFEVGRDERACCQAMTAGSQDSTAYEDDRWVRIECWGVSRTSEAAPRRAHPFPYEESKSVACHTFVRKGTLARSITAYTCLLPVVKRLRKPNPSPSQPSTHRPSSKKGQRTSSSTSNTPTDSRKEPRSRCPPGSPACTSRTRACTCVARGGRSLRL